MRLTLLKTMKSALAALLLVAFALAQSPAKIPTPKASAPAAIEDEGSRKARALVDKAIEALGGQAYLTYATRSEQGRSYSLYHGRARDAGIVYRRFYRFGDKDRIEVALGNGASWLDVVQTQAPLPLPDPKSNKKADIAVIHNGDKGYEVTYKGTEQEEPKTTVTYLRRRSRSLEQVLRSWIKDPATAFFYDGSALAANQLADQVTITNSKNESVTLYLDSTTHVPIKKTFSWRDPSDKERNTEEEVYDNYKRVQDILTPYSLTRFYNGDMAYQRFLSKITYNDNLADSLFEATLTK